MKEADIIDNLYQGIPIKCSSEEYPEIRTIIQNYAGQCIDRNDYIRSIIALEEVRRLDKLFSL